MPPDISMCADDECPSRAKCYRSKASGTKPCEYRQAFADFEREPEDERCGYFWPNVTAPPVASLRNAGLAKPDCPNLEGGKHD
jgi:hypothetical protein